MSILNWTGFPLCCFLRQITEGVEIQRTEQQRLMNTRSEWNSSLVLLPAALAAAETKKFATKDTRFNYIRRVC